MEKKLHRIEGQNQKEEKKGNRKKKRKLGEIQMRVVDYSVPYTKSWERTEAFADDKVCPNIHLLQVILSCLKIKTLLIWSNCLPLLFYVLIAKTLRKRTH